jgi:hypothetical protein
MLLLWDVVVCFVFLGGDACGVCAETWCASCNYLADIYVTNTGAKKSTKSIRTKKSIAILKSIAIWPV